MKARTKMLMMLACLPVISFAQNDDDMYFVPKKKAKAVQETTTNVPTAIQSEEYYSGALRDVDEYNRRGTNATTDNPNYIVENQRDTVYVVVDNQNDLYDDYELSARLARFHGYGYPYYSWYDPWYYDPWYYDPWYYGPRWSVGFGWYGYHNWYDPWYFGPYYAGWGYYGGYPYHHHHPTAGGGTPQRGFNGGRGYAMNTSPRGTMGSSRTGDGTRNGYTTTRTGRTGTTGLNSSRGYTIGSRADRGGTRGMIDTSRGSTSTTVRGITGSSSRSTVNNSSSRTSNVYRGTSSSTSRSSSSSSYSGASRGSSGSSRSSSSGGFSSGSSRGGGFSSGGSRGSSGGRR